MFTALVEYPTTNAVNMGTAKSLGSRHKHSGMAIILFHTAVATNASFKKHGVFQN